MFDEGIGVRTEQNFEKGWMDMFKEGGIEITSLFCPGCHCVTEGVVFSDDEGIRSADLQVVMLAVNTGASEFVLQMSPSIFGQRKATNFFFGVSEELVEICTVVAYTRHKWGNGEVNT